ncbi:hypothetical protein Dimus_011225, partial [Dionaea muscipula]
MANSKEIGRIITVFVDDIPDTMVHRDLWKLYSSLGVVKDVFIPRIRNKSGRRFSFVRFDCPVAVEVAIQKTNGLWVKDKELRVKQADFNRTAPVVQDSYASVVARGGSLQDDLPTVKVQSIGNGWLYKSVVATFTDQRTQDLMFDSFISKIKGILVVRRLGFKKILISFISEAEIDEGEVLNVDDDTARCSFVIRVAEEQVVFICNSNFSCQCSCYGKEDERVQSPKTNMEEDDVNDGEAARASHDGNDSWQSFIAETHEPNGGDEWAGVSGLDPGPGPQRLLTDYSAPVFNVNGINLEVVLGSGDKEEGFNNLMLKHDNGRKELNRVDCCPIIPFEELPGNHGNGGMESLLPISEDVERPRKRDRPRNLNAISIEVAKEADRSVSLLDPRGMSDSHTFEHLGMNSDRLMLMGKENSGSPPSSLGGANSATDQSIVRGNRD